MVKPDTPPAGPHARAESGRVSFVPTPIGNLADITLRALDTLRAADLIACEDTRHTRRLLQHHSISRPTLSLHGHNEAARIPEIIARVRQGARIAVVSDAGTPGISDPGNRLAAACHLHHLPFEILPGPCAIPAALVGSGLPAAEFNFRGFLPIRKGRREKALAEALASQTATTLFYESPHRLLSTLEILASLDPARLCCIAREISKTFETFHRAPTAELLNHFSQSSPKGEIVILVAPANLPSFLTRETPSPQ